MPFAFAGLRPCFALTLALGLSVVARPAFGQTDEQRAAARSLATEGATAFNEGRYKDAVDFFGKAESLVHAPPHLLFMARAYAKLGALVKAREAYLKVAKETLPPNAPQAFRDAQSAAAEEVKAIEPRIAALTVRVEGGEGKADVAVLLDGAPIPAILVGAPQPIDPGEHKLEAGAPGLRSTPTTVVLADGERKSVTLALVSAPGAPALVVAPAPAGEPAAGPAAPPPQNEPVATSAPPTQDRGTGDGKSGMRIGSYVAFGVGAIGLGLGTVFVLQASSKRSDADAKFEECGGATGCTTDNPLSAEVDELDNSADSAKTLGIVGFAVGGVGVATGVTLLLLSSGNKEKPAASIQPWVGFGSAGVKGRF
ncbi:MAG TPA: hypothetical protein VGK73_35760 [Polyangiaceae bacterium]